MNDMELARQLMEAIRQTDEWEAIWQEYPGVVEAKGQLDRAVEQISAHVPGELVNQLWEAFSALDWANECACVLFGFRLACSVNRAAADPAGFPQYIQSHKKPAGA